MKAAICYEYGAPLVIDEIKISAPQEGEVKVKLAATAICHSDVHLLQGAWPGKLPVIAGHESVGIITEVGPGVDDLQPGDRVVVSLLRSCGCCPECLADLPHLCSGKFAVDLPGRMHDLQEKPITRGINTASFAEYTLVHHSQCVRIPESIPAESACLLACGVITGVGVVRNTAQVNPGSRAAVIGIGGVGLNVLQGLVLSQASKIIAVDLVEEKLKAARDFGATETVDARNDDPVSAVRERNDGLPVDYAFVTVGSLQAMEQAAKMVRRGGTVVITGLTDSAAAVPVRVYPLVTGERRILGSFMGSTNLRRDVPHLVELYQQGKLKLDELVSSRYPLEQINEAIADMEHGQARRNVIMF